MKKGNVIFKVSLLAKTRPGKEEGFIQLWKYDGKRVGHKAEAFDHLKDLVGDINRILSHHRIQWPPKP